MKHKLVKIENGEIITKQALKDILIAANFDILPIAPLVNFVCPTRPTGKKYIFLDGKYQTNPEWTAYETLFNERSLAFTADKIRYQTEQQAAEQKLINTFDGIVTYTKTTETDSKGMAIWRWLPSTKYNYYQCMSVLTNKDRPSNVIDFICFNNFGS